MDSEKMTQVVRALNNKAVDAHDSMDALKWSQAAQNAANSFCALATAIQQWGRG